MARMYSEDAYCLGLIYVFLYSNKMIKMVELDSLNKYHATIEKNLIEMNSGTLDNYATLCYDNGESIYFTSSNIDGETYYILKPEFDLERAKILYIGCLSIDVLIASQMDNALDCLGLIKINGNIITKQSYYSELAKKHNLLQKELTTERPKFDVFESGAKIAKNGFIEKFCLSEEERLIVEDLRRKQEPVKKLNKN